MADLLSPALWTVVERCAAGGMPPNVALMRILMESPTEGDAAAVVNGLHDLARTVARDAGKRIRAIVSLHAAHPDAWKTVKRVIATTSQSHSEMIDPDCAAHDFDAAARLSPEAGVALYALGDPDLLAAATTEIVEQLKAWNLAGRDRLVLDLGCGIGRVAAQLAAEGAHVMGVDVSFDMLAEARRRSTSALFVRTSGWDLSCIADGCVDLVLAVDAFPYLVAAGLAKRHVLEASRLLRPGGTLLLLNFSYRDDDELDAGDVAVLAEAAHMTVVRMGERPFALWDGAAYQLRRSPGG